MKASIARQREQHQRRHAEKAALERTNGIHALGGEGHKAPDTFRPRSHGWCGSHNKNTKATSGTRHRAYPRGLFGVARGTWVSVGGATYTTLTDEEIAALDRVLPRKGKDDE